ncbi:MAG: protein-L-isoaspartate(D-aspartate) O-methyltransferase [Candidatus Kerfeldbacteria bacterium]|nr:protein-L-isoaspartate(D-aspartate) O-methyltransferase [Candidatus Kerfeldbacteria bacterium]
MKALIEQLKEQGLLKTPAIIRAFEVVDRVGFVKPEFVTDAGLNEPLPIGFGQTISQPLTVAFMLELLQPQPGQRVLDVGSGSAWTTALLAELVGPSGKVYAIERIPQLKTFGQENLKRAGYQNVEFFSGDGARGLSEFAPFDRIQVAAAAREVPPALLAQLAVDGRLVIPLGEYVQDVTVIEKRARGQYREQRFPGFQFVPLITD